MTDHIEANRDSLSAIMDLEDYDELPALNAVLDSNDILTLDANNRLVCNLETSDAFKDRITRLAHAVFSCCIMTETVDEEDFLDVVNAPEDKWTYPCMSQDDVDATFLEFHNHREEPEWKPVGGWLAAYLYSRFGDASISELFY